MFFILSKILSFSIQPIIWITVLLVLSVASKSVSRKRRFSIGALVIFLFFSNQFIFNEISSAWENQIPAFNSKAKFDIVMVLGGISAYDSTHNQPEFFGSSERLLNVLPLYFDGQVAKIMFVGGSGNLNQTNVEADFIKDYLLKIGVKETDLIIENKSRNTYENATFAAALIPPNQSLLLSTSATHMPRSLACFHKLNIFPTPFPVDYTSSSNPEIQFNQLFIPSAEVVNKWYWLLHEWIGILTYKIRGYC